MSPCSASSSGSSLLHLRRPAQLLAQAPKPCLQVVVDSDTEGPEGVHSVSSSPTSFVFSSSTRFVPPRVDPCMKVDTDCSTTGYLQRPCIARRQSSFEGLETDVSSFNSESILLLRSVRPQQDCLTAKPKEEWQPDEDCAFCNHPFCSTMFGQTSLPIGPRRHHCRLCGLIFCNTHSTGRLSMLPSNGRNYPTLQRVCDGCRGTSQEDSNDRRRPSETAPSLVSSEGSAHDDNLASPKSSRFLRNLSSVTFDESEDCRLAPIEEWMDRSGILSLYPLAVQPSHSRRARSPSSIRAAGPLFAPTMSDRRSAKERELERQSLRQRRNVCVWVTTPACSDVESEDEDESRPYRQSKGSRSEGTRTPLERELDWSTF